MSGGAGIWIWKHCIVHCTLRSIWNHEVAVASPENEHYPFLGTLWIAVSPESAAVLCDWTQYWTAKWRRADTPSNSAADRRLSWPNIDGAEDPVWCSQVILWMGTQGIALHLIGLRLYEVSSCLRLSILFDNFSISLWNMIFPQTALVTQTASRQFNIDWN